MKAAVLAHPSADPQQAFRIDEVAQAQPRPGEMVIRLAAASINPLDTLMRNGYGDALFRWLRRPGPRILGLDGAGSVAAVGPGVAGFKEGDRVMAATWPFRGGFYAESVAVAASSAAHIPRGVSFETAAALPYAGLTARGVLRAAGLGPATARGQRVLVHGGAGGIGSLLVQMLSHWGAHVASTCSARNLEFVRSLGAAQVVDYTREDFSQVLRDFDAVINTITPKTDRLDEAPHFAVLRHGGRYLSLISPTLTLADRLSGPLGLAASGTWMMLARARWAAAGKSHRWVYFRASGKDLAELAEWMRAGVFTPQVGRCFPLEQVAQAHAAVEAGPAHGKVLLIMGAGA